MRRRDARRYRRTRPLIAALLLGAGCAGSGGPPPIATGTPCAASGMEVQDLRFACERRAGGAWRVYDAIECRVRDTGNAATPPGTGDAWLADYDMRTLHVADSLWVVRGAFASPMGGGLAAFRDRAAADSVAAMTSGRVDRLAAFMAEPIGPTP
jgi:hypothetical protein